MGGEFHSLKSLAREAQKQSYPQSLQVRVISRNRSIFQEKWGRPYKYFDVGSLTKIMVTTPLVMKLWEESLIDLKAPVSTYLGFLKGVPAGSVVVEDLLRHISGLEWWRPFYEKLRHLPWARRDFALKKKFQSEKVSDARRCVYSDLDFICLGWILESILGISLDEAARLHLFNPMGLSHTFFIRQGDRGPGGRGDYAPTENHVFRGRLQKTVFDDNAWAMGGVSGHAGLYSTLEDVSRFGQILLDVWNGKNAGIWKPSTVRLFTRRAVSRKQGDWALGFVIPSRPLSTAGTKVSSLAFGHTGYTGTSLWIDPKRQAVVTILSNRTFPTRRDERFLNLRRQLHDAVWEQLDGQKI